MSKRRAVLLMEVVLAAAVAALAFLTFMSVSNSSYEYASMSRNRAVAGMLARSLMAEIEVHPYGAEAPLNWEVQDEHPVSVWIQGRPVAMNFHKEFKYLNSSFITPGSALNSDVVNVTISWRESAGNQAPGDKVVADDTKRIVVSVPVWR